MRKPKSTLVLFAVIMSMLLSVAAVNAFADERGWHQGGGRHERVQYRGERYEYHEGRFYRPSLFGLILDLVAPPRGVVVTYLPTGYRTVFIGGTAYYEYDNVYYQPSSGGYVVVQPPVAANDYVSPNVVYAPVPYVATPTQPSEGEPVTVNVRTSRRGTIAITLMRYSNGFVGPQGEFYPSFPSTAELRARYDR